MNDLTKFDSNTALARIDRSLIDDLAAENSLSEPSQQSYWNDIDHFNEYLDDTGQIITPESIRSYFQTIQDQYKPATLNRKKYALLRALRQQYKDNALQRTAIGHMIEHSTETYKVNKAVEEDEVLTPEQVQELESLASERLKLIIRFLWITACRITELITIRLEKDIVSLNGHVGIQLIGKNNKERKVKITQELYHKIRETFHGETYLFETRSGNQYHRNNLYKQLQRLDTELPRNPHIFRHSRATYLLKNGFSLKAVSRFLGHSSTAITADLYIHDSIDYEEMFALDAQNSV